MWLTPLAERGVYVKQRALTLVPGRGRGELRGRVEGTVGNFIKLTHQDALMWACVPEAVAQLDLRVLAEGRVGEQGRKSLPQVVPPLSSPCHRLGYPCRPVISHQVSGVTHLCLTGSRLSVYSLPPHIYLHTFMPISWDLAQVLHFNAISSHLPEF